MKWREAMQQARENGVEPPITVVHRTNKISHSILEHYPFGFDLMAHPGADTYSQDERAVDVLLTLTGINDDLWEPYREVSV